MDRIVPFVLCHCARPPWVQVVQGQLTNAKHAQAVTLGRTEDED